MQRVARCRGDGCALLIEEREGRLPAAGELLFDGASAGDAELVGGGHPSSEAVERTVALNAGTSAPVLELRGAVGVEDDGDGVQRESPRPYPGGVRGEPAVGLSVLRERPPRPRIGPR